MSVCVCVVWCVWRPAGNQKSILAVFLSFSPLYLLRQDGYLSDPLSPVPVTSECTVLYVRQAHDLCLLTPVGNEPAHRSRLRPHKTCAHWGKGLRKQLPVTLAKAQPGLFGAHSGGDPWAFQSCLLSPAPRLAYPSSNELFLPSVRTGSRRAQERAELAWGRQLELLGRAHSGCSPPSAKLMTLKHS